MILNVVVMIVVEVSMKGIIIMKIIIMMKTLKWILFH